MLLPQKNQFSWQKGWAAPSWPGIRPRTAIITSLTIFCFIFIATSFVHPDPLRQAYHEIKGQFREHGLIPPTSAVPAISEDARNSTLGFEKIFYISLPDRTDRQDAMTLLSDMVGIDSTYVPGVDGGATPPEAKIIGSKLRPGVFGCWRSHANVWRKMLEEHVTTALILEDDIDFDVDIKQQLHRISEGIQTGPNLVSDDPATPVDQRGPYGTEWDLLFIGLCAHKSPKDAGPDNTPYITFDDATVLDQPLLQSHHRAEFEKFGVDANQTRLLVPLHSYWCTQAYAVTNRGARRLLYELGYKDVTSPVDNVMSWTTEAGALKGIAPVPPLVSQFKVGGNIDSNINGKDHTAAGVVDKEKGHGRGIMNSARAALKAWVEPADLEEKHKQRQQAKEAAQRKKEEEAAAAQQQQQQQDGSLQDENQQDETQQAEAAAES